MFGQAWGKLDAFSQKKFCLAQTARIYIDLVWFGTNYMKLGYFVN